MGPFRVSRPFPSVLVVSPLSQVTVVMMPVQTALSAPRLQPTPIACFPPVEEDLHCAEFAGQYTLMKGN